MTQQHARLLGHDWVERAEPAADAAVARLAQAFGGPVPEGLAALWRASDGLRFGAFEGELLGASAVLALLDGRRWPEELVARGMLPLFHDGQSNHLVVHLQAPLAPRVSFAPHDDSSRVRYRSVESFLADLLVGLNDRSCADLLVNEAEGDYAPDAPRTEQDLADARALLARGSDSDLRNAIPLLDASCRAEWARLLETDHFVRRDARAQLAGMSSPVAQELLRADAAAFEEFAAFATEAARAAGLEVRERSGDSLRIGTRWFNLDALFYRRRIPDAFERLVAWFAAAASGGDRRATGYLP